jgi:hypothetical protein
MATSPNFIAPPPAADSSGQPPQAARGAVAAPSVQPEPSNNIGLKMVAQGMLAAVSCSKAFPDTAQYMDQIRKLWQQAALTMQSKQAPGEPAAPPA